MLPSSPKHPAALQHTGRRGVRCAESDMRARTISVFGRMDDPKTAEGLLRGESWQVWEEAMERKTGFEPVTLSLARRCSTSEPLPQCLIHHNYSEMTASWQDVEASRLQSQTKGLHIAS